MLRKLSLIIIGFMLFLGLATACTGQELEIIEVTVIVEPTAMPVPAEVPQLPFEGVWFTQDRSSMLVITAETLYIHEFGPNREVYARIDGYDLGAETIDVFTTAILMGGMSMGYDSPSIQISYHVNGTVMEFLGQHIDFAPDEEGPVIYIFDEFLN